MGVGYHEEARSRAIEGESMMGVGVIVLTEDTVNRHSVCEHCWNQQEVINVHLEF